MSSVLEHRWLILGEDGRHIWLGRARDPDEAEIYAAQASLAARSEAGWLVVAEGDYWATGTLMTLLSVCPLAEPKTAFEVAARRFEAIRTRRRANLKGKTAG